MGFRPRRCGRNRSGSHRDIRSQRGRRPRGRPFAAGQGSGRVLLRPSSCSIYPMLDDREITPSSHWQVPIWSPENNRFGWRCYLGDLYGQDDIPPYGAPARAEDLQGLPPASVWVGTSDIFCDENILYAQRLIQAGIPTELTSIPMRPTALTASPPIASWPGAANGRSATGWPRR